MQKVITGVFISSLIGRGSGAYLMISHTQKHTKLRKKRANQKVYTLVGQPLFCGDMPTR